MRARPVPTYSNHLDVINFDDLETSKLIAQLTLDDIDEVGGRRKGKARVDAPASDEEIAFRDQREYWEGVIRTIDDHILAQSINNAIASDRPYINVLAAMEQAATDDRAAALALSRGEALPTPSRAQRSMETKEFFEPLKQ
jgi:hypothetical protein